jgi:hypothetical protein
VTHDPDFPRPAPDHAALRRDVACERGMAYLAACATVSPEGASWAAYDWLIASAAGVPDNPLGFAREDARFWAEVASPPELEAYALAAMDKIAGAPFASRHIKRLIAALWGRMHPIEQQAFKDWIEK